MDLCELGKKNDAFQFDTDKEPNAMLFTKWTFKSDRVDNLKPKVYFHRFA